MRFNESVHARPTAIALHRIASHRIALRESLLQCYGAIMRWCDGAMRCPVQVRLFEQTPAEMADTWPDRNFEALLTRGSDGPAGAARHHFFSFLAARYFPPGLAAVATAPQPVATPAAASPGERWSSLLHSVSGAVHEGKGQLSAWRARARQLVHRSQTST